MSCRELLCDGIARFIDFDRDGDMDFVTSLPNPKRWVLYHNQSGKLSKKPFWESGAYGNLRFFSEETFQQMLPQKLDKLLGPDAKVTWGVGLTWFRRNGLSQRTIGHGSASFCTLRVDLEKDLVITMTRRTAGKNFREYHPKFIEAVTSSVAD